MYSKQTTVVNKAGLHARPATEFVMKAKSFTADVTVRNMDKNGAAVNAKSIVRLLGEGLGTGERLDEIKGEQRGRRHGRFTHAYGASGVDSAFSINRRISTPS